MKPYRLIHYLSLDIVAGAAGFSCFAARGFPAEPGWAWRPFLALTVWLIGNFLDRSILAPSVFLAALVLFMNLVVISLYDTRPGKRMGIDSMARVLGKQTIVSIIWVTAVMIFILLLMQFLIYGMALILMIILLLPGYFNRNRYYRMAADAVLIMGFLALLVP